MASVGHVPALREGLIMSKRKKQKAWSLTFELYMLGDAVEAARILTDAAAVDQLANEHDNQRAVASAAAVLTLVGLRVRDLGRVLRGEMDPDLLRARHNESEADAEGRDVTSQARKRDA